MQTKNQIFNIKVIILSLFIGIFNISTACLAQQNYIILKSMIDSNTVYAVVSPEGKELKTYEGLTNVATTNGKTFVTNIKLNKSGFLDEKGEWLIKPTYSNIILGYFVNGYGILYQGGEELWSCSVIDSTGKVIIPFSLIKYYAYSDSWCYYNNQETNEEGYDNLQGKKIVLKKGERGRSFSNTKAIISNMDTYYEYYINTEGKPLFDNVYAEANNFESGYAVVKENNKKPYTLIDENGKTVYTFAERIDQTPYYKGNGWVDLNNGGMYNYIYDNTLINIFNKTPQTEYKTIAYCSSASEGLTPTKQGYIDQDGNLVIDIKGEYYKEEKGFNKGRAVISKPLKVEPYGKIYYLIDTTGKTLWQSSIIE